MGWNVIRSCVNNHRCKNQAFSRDTRPKIVGARLEVISDHHRGRHVRSGYVVCHISNSKLRSNHRRGRHFHPDHVICNIGQGCKAVSTPAHPPTITAAKVKSTLLTQVRRLSAIPRSVAGSGTHGIIPSMKKVARRTIRPTPSQPRRQRWRIG